MVRLLLDEDIDLAFRFHFGENVQVETVQYRGWKGLRNGDLLRAAEREYDAFVTMDDNLPDQQNLASFDLAVLILRARSKRLDDLVELVPALQAALVDLKPGRALRIHPPK